MKLLEELRRSSSIYRCDKQRLELAAVDNDGSHTSKRVERYVEDSPAGGLVCTRCPRGARKAIR